MGKRRGLRRLKTRTVYEKISAVWGEERAGKRQFQHRRRHSPLTSFLFALKRHARTAKALAKNQIPAPGLHQGRDEGGGEGLHGKRGSFSQQMEGECRHRRYGLLPKIYFKA